MGLYETLLETYGQNEPILKTEITYKNYSKPWIAKELAKLCDDKKIVRFEKGVYYIPSQTPFGPGKLNPYKVLEKKYLYKGSDVIGYYAGVKLLNQTGLSTQMANAVEIYTNNETSIVREVKIGSQKVLLRKARTSITKENAAVLCFLELMNQVPASYFNDERRAVIKNYIQEKQITRKDITCYAPVFPDKAMRTLVESEVIYLVTL